MSDSSSSTELAPFEEQRRVFDLLSQETRHLVIQYILGHPEHLISLDELDYMIPKSKAAISDQLDNLVEAGILDLYRYKPSEGKRDLPSKFHGFTQHGIDVLHEYNYLRGVPVARALYKNTRKSEKIERHEAAPRPDLPDAVSDALSSDEAGTSSLENHVREATSNEETVDELLEITEALASLASEGDDVADIAIGGKEYRLVEKSEGVAETKASET